MIKIVQGDITKATENIIVHQVNCQGKMGSGVALSIKKAFPNAYNQYMELYNEESTTHVNTSHLLGHVQIVKVGEGPFSDKYVANLFGQEFYGTDGSRYTSYDALYNGLKFIYVNAKRAGKSVAIPYKIGSDRGGADWDIVRYMIDKIFHDYPVALYQYSEGK